MSLYEHVFVARPELSPAQVETLVAKFSDIIKKEGGSVEKTEYCGLRSLAYPIKKNTKGHYVLMNLTAPTTLVKELERNIRLNEDIIRYLTVAVEAHETTPSQLIQQSRAGPDKYADKKKRYDRDRDSGPRETEDSNEEE